MGKYEIDEDFDNEIYDLGGITKEMPNYLWPMRMKLSSICSL
jgi:hypothetical protein